MKTDGLIRRPRRAQPHSRPSFWAKWLAAGYAVGSSFRVLLVGQILVAEILAVASLPFINIRRLIRTYPALGTILLGYAIALGSLIVSDMINDRSSANYLRGWGGFIFAMIDLVFLTYVIGRNENSVIYYLVFSCVTRVIFVDQSLDMDVLDAQVNSFKSKVVPFLFPGILVFSTIMMKTNWRYAVGALLIGSILFILLGARSSGGVLFLTAGILAFRMSNRRPSVSYIVLGGAAFLFASFFLYEIYVDHVLSTQTGGNAYAQLARLDNPYNPLELLSEGRTETIVAATAIKDRPFFGFGSWASDGGGTYAALMIELRDDYTHAASYYREWIPAHSVLLTAWLWGGLGCFIGMCIVFWAAARQFWRGLWANTYLLPIMCAVAIEFFWNMFFSPLGHIRTSFPFTLAILAVVPMREALAAKVGSAAPRVVVNTSRALTRWPSRRPLQD